MGKRERFSYHIEPGDRDHMPSYYFTDGVVEADPDEIEQLKADVAARHRWLLTIGPYEEPEPESIEDLKAAIGNGISIVHAEVDGTEPCPEDAPYLAAADQSAAGGDVGDEDE